jgi:head-tail adaptor
MLTTAELTAMRDAIKAATFPDTAYILSGTLTSDGMGGNTTSWGTTGTAICRLDMVQGNELLAGGAIQPFTRYVLSLPYDATIASTNRVQIGTSTYSVKSINAGQSWSAVTRVELEAV